MNLVIALTDGIRAWGAASLLMALPVLLPFVLLSLRMPPWPRALSMR